MESSSGLITVNKFGFRWPISCIFPISYGLILSQENDLKLEIEAWACLLASSLTCFASRWSTEKKVLGWRRHDAEGQ